MENFIFCTVNHVLFPAFYNPLLQLLKFHLCVCLREILYLYVILESLYSGYCCKASLNHSHKKRKDSIETRAVRLIFSLKLEISGGGRTGHTSKQRKLVAFVRNCLVKVTLRLFQPFSDFMAMVPMLLRQFSRSLQIKKSIANAPRVL